MRAPDGSGTAGDLVFAGIDGCPGAWFGVIARANGVHCVREVRLASLCDAFADASAIFIDIPLGLPVRQPRSADRLARKLLTGRASSVFPVPCRAAVYATSWEEACDENVRELGSRLSKQSWNICNKIREADELGHPLLYEAHPEICFQHLAGAPLVHGKKRPAGCAERLGLLPAAFQQAYAEAVAQWRRKDLARDDILDACALAVCGPALTAHAPDPPEVDARGKAMAIRVTPGQLASIAT